MLTLLEVLNRTESFFSKAGIERARLDAELILAHALGCKRLQLYLQFDRPLEEDVLQAIRPLVRRRAQREPLQHVVGSVEFFDLQLKSDARALVPRQETEQLVEILGERLSKDPPRSILDLGTGTGAIALALAKSFPDAEVTATDRSADALSLARENAEASGLQGRIRFLRGSWFEAVPKSTIFDLIVSNPPYLTEAEWNEAAPEVREHDPKEALVAGKDGQSDLNTILQQAPAFLCPGGILALETGIAQHDALLAMAGQAGFAPVDSLKDYSGRPRFIFTRLKKADGASA